ncbi:pilus assembly protein TadG-related protein [Nesterenkonia sp. NBAIMH1]|uniref:pilus assembly protein TadG-related protein n=1 Tax=Nesterenkonia sp. NBAIMH1 TaxID=2600320 RepID=UPI0011B6C155|nr:pilus assembly protein TadG-related protein [Nesterenkonia sp. NBAIMH1]
MQRVKNDDRGAVGIIVALMLVPIMILAALAIDVAAMHADRQQLRTGADAAALAAAQDCAGDDCDTTDVTAETMAKANFNGSGAEGSVTHLDEKAGEVSVQTSSVREHWFGPIVGINSTELEAESSARWGYPTGGTAVLPLAFSWCELVAQSNITPLKDETGTVVGVDMNGSGEEVTIQLPKHSDTGCNGPSGNPLPGGFGWLTPNPENCGETKSVVGGVVGGDPGNSIPSACEAQDFEDWIGKTVLLPIFNEATGEGSDAQFRIFGYAAFTLSGYRFSGAEYPASSSPCSGSQRCVRGSFDRFVDLSEDFEYSPDSPRMGASVVALTPTSSE